MPILTYFLAPANGKRLAGSIGRVPIFEFH